MKKMLALGAMAVVLGLSYGFEVAPAMAVSSSEGAAVSATDVAAAVTRAEEAIAKTANATVNAAEVAAMREYLQKWVAQARTLDLGSLTAGQMKELIAALNEGALGLRMKAGVDRKVATGASSSSSSSSNAAVGAGTTVNGTVAEPRTAKADDAKVTSVAEVAEVKTVAPVAKTVQVASTSTTSVASTASVAKAEVAPETVKTVAATADMNALATLAVAQVKKPTAILASAGLTSAGAENTEVDVPKTGANDEEEQTSNAVRGMGLVLGGAVVLAAAGAVLIVKRMKRGL